MLQRLVDAAAVEAEIERVRSLSGAALRRRWQSEFGRPLPRGLTIDLLRRMIANRIQEEAFGTLDRATLKLLDGLARRDGARKGERNLKIGTVLVRDYQGRRHTVTVRPRAMSGRAPPIPACRRSRGPLPARFGTARVFSPSSPSQETIRSCTAAAAHALPSQLNHPHGRAKPRRSNTPHCVGVSSMSPRPYWKGYLKLSLVSCPI